MMLGDPFDMAPLRNRVFCTFMDCATCGQFFRDAYTSSCGTSVVMQVAGQYSAAEAHSFVAFGRFETCSEPTFSLGHQLHLDDMQVSCSATNSLAMWFPSDSPSDENPRTFTFKEKQHTPWHYGWTSGASAALRNTQHGYLFHVMAESPNVLQLVGIAQSPGFIIVPYKPLGHGTYLPLPSRTRHSMVHAEAVDTVPPDSISVDIIDVAPASSAFDCHFVSCQCEKPMFGDNYIRCFPHCCPEHILHCSCGGPIMCGVNLSLAPPLARPAKELVMYAHGERFNMPELHLHDELPHDLILSRLHQPGNERGDWVKGVVQPGISTPTTLLFNFNQNSRQAGWPYNWKGSATKVDRNRKHVFKAYVFQVLRGGHTLRVVNWVSSTPFTMSSFRRCNTTPTSRTNSYIEVKPTEITDLVAPVPRKRSLDRIESPPSVLHDLHSAG
ncbi:hypothetical protein B5M09_008416 [Aphanomyces astaci]|uniref:Uncharacterized protein n=1 Tax=Aphanomyces astaci TaxID=112090 RepID=A0A3R7XCQ8_APHAT|nr:hypothetical protein B5M09_008416 [Aphanomyces astaci]